MRDSTKGWPKAAVVTFGVMDCVGIYVAQDRLAVAGPVAPPATIRAADERLTGG